MSTMTLEPCPFCGSEKIATVPVANIGHAISCDGCGASSEVGPTVEQAATKWNRRAHLAQPAQAVDVGARLRAYANDIESAIACGEMDVYQTFTQMRQLLTRALSGEKGLVGRYRLLGSADVIEPDDEFLDDNAVTWVRAGSAKGGHLFIGMQYALGVLKPARRALPASLAPDKDVLCGHEKGCACLRPGDNMCNCASMDKE